MHSHADADATDARRRLLGIMTRCVIASRSRLVTIVIALPSIVTVTSIATIFVVAALTPPIPLVLVVVASASSSILLLDLPARLLCESASALVIGASLSLDLLARCRGRWWWCLCVRHLQCRCELLHTRRRARQHARYRRCRRCACGRHERSRVPNELVARRRITDIRFVLAGRFDVVR
jgi:hypothetical protein